MNDVDPVKRALSTLRVFIAKQLHTNMMGPNPARMAHVARCREAEAALELVGERLREEEPRA